MQGTPRTPEELLAVCLERGAAEDWIEFVRATQPALALAVMRTARGCGDGSADTVDDLVQEIYVKLCADNCAILRELETRHPNSLIGFLKALAVNSTLDHFKRERSRKRWGHLVREQSQNTESHADPKAGPGHLDRKILVREIDRCLAEELPEAERERNRRVFWLYYRHGLTARAISELPSIGLTMKGVETTVLRMTRIVRNRIGQAGVSGP